MTDLSALQDHVDNVLRRASIDMIPPDQQQKLKELGVRLDDPDQRLSATTERRQLAGERYEFKPQNEIEKGFAEDNARKQEAWINQVLPDRFGAPKLVRNPDLDSEDPNKGDVYEIGASIFPRNLSREQRYAEGLGEYLPFGSETIGGIGSGLVDSALGVGTLLDSRTFGLGSDAVEIAGETAGFDMGEFNQAAEDWAEFNWQNDPKMATAQAVAVGQTAANPRMMLRSMAAGAPAAAARVPGLGQALSAAARPLSRGLTGTALGRGALDATGAAISTGLALRGESGFDQEYVDEVYDTPISALWGGEGGPTMRYAIPGLAAALPIMGGAGRELRRQFDPTERAWRHAADSVDTDEMLAASARGDDLRVADFAPEASRGAMPFAGSESQREFRDVFRDRAAGRQSVMTNDLAQRLNVDGYINAGTVNDDTLEFGRSLRSQREDEARSMYGQLDGARIADGPLAPHLRDPVNVPDHRDPTFLNQDEARDLVRQGEEIGVGGDARKLEVAENRRPARGGRLEIPDDATLDAMSDADLNRLMRSNRLPYRRMYPNDDMSQPALTTPAGNPRVPSATWKRERLRRLRAEIGAEGPSPRVAAAREAPLRTDEAEEAWVDASIRVREAERAVEAAQPRTDDPTVLREWARSDEGRELLGELSTARSSLTRAQRNFTAASREVDSATFDPKAPGGSGEVPVARLRALKSSTNDAIETARRAGKDGEARALSIYNNRLRNFLEETVRNAAGVRVSMIGDRRWHVLSQAADMLDRAAGINTKTGERMGSGFFGMEPEEIRVMLDELAAARRAIDEAPRLNRAVKDNLLADFDLAYDAMRVGVVRNYNKLIQSTPFRRGSSVPNDLHEATAARLRMLFNNDQELDDFSRSLGVQTRQVDTEGRILGGPDTADKIATQEAFEQAAGDPQLGSRLLGGIAGMADSLLIDVPAALYRITRDRFYTGLNRNMANEFLRIMQRDDLEAVAREIEAARRGGRAPNVANLSQRTQARIQQGQAAARAANQNAPQPNAPSGAPSGAPAPGANQAAAPRQSLPSDEPIPPARSDFYKLQRSLFEKYNTRPGDSIEEAYQRGEIEEADFRAWSAAQRRAAASETAQEPDARTPGDYRRAVQDDERAIAEEIRTNDAKEDLPVLDAGSIGAVPDGQLNRGTANNVYRALRARLLALPEADQRRIIADLGEVAEIDPKRAPTLENAADRLIGMRVNRTRVYGEKLIRPLLQRLEDEISASEGGRRAGLGGDLDRTPRASLGRDGANARADQYVSIVKDLKGNVAAAREIAKIAAEDATLTPDARRRIIEALTSSSAKTGSAKELSDAIDLTAKKAWDKEFIFLGEDTAGGQAARAAIGRHRNDAAGIVARARETLDAPPIPVDDGTRPPSMWGVVGDADRAGDDLDPTNRSSRRIDRERAGPGERTPIRSRADREAQNLEITGRQYDGTILAGRLRKAAEHPAVSPDLRLRVERYIGGISRTGLREADEIGTGRRKGFSGRDLQPATHADRPVETVSLSGRQGRPSNNEVDRFDNFEDGRRLLNEIERVVDEAEARRAPAQPGAAAGEGANGARPQPPDRAPADETPPDSPADIVPERAPAPWDTIEGGYTRPIAEIDSAVTKVRDDIRNLIRLVKGERLPDGIEYKDISRLRDKAEQDLTKASIRLATLGEDSPQAQVLRNTIDDQFLALVQAQDAFGRLGADLGERFDDVASGMRDVSRMGDTGRNPRLPGAGEDITPGFTYGDWDKVRAHLAGDAPEDALLVEIVENIEARMGEAGPTAAGRMLNDVDKTKFKVLLSRALANADDAAEEIAHIVYALDMIPAKEMAEVRKIAKRWHVAESKRLGHDFLEPYRREAQRLGLSPEQTREMLEEELVVKWLSRSETWKQPKGLKGRVAAILRQMGQLIKRAVSTSAKASQRADRFQSGRMAKDIEKALVDAMTKGTREAMEGRSPVREIVRASRSLETAGQ